MFGENWRRLQSGARLMKHKPSVKKLRVRVTHCPPSILIQFHGINSMTLMKVDDMYNVFPLRWIGTPDISSLGPYYIWHRYTCTVERGINREGFNFKLAMVKTCSTWPLLNMPSIISNLYNSFTLIVLLLGLIMIVAYAEGGSSLFCISQRGVITFFYFRQRGGHVFLWGFIVGSYRPPSGRNNERFLMDFVLSSFFFLFSFSFFFFFPFFSFFFAKVRSKELNF